VALTFPSLRWDEFLNQVTDQFDALNVAIGRQFVGDAQNQARVEKFNEPFHALNQRLFGIVRQELKCVDAVK
jgi:hypothetical protein